MYLGPLFYQHVKLKKKIKLIIRKKHIFINKVKYFLTSESQHLKLKTNNLGNVDVLSK